MNCIIVDDEPLAREGLENLIKETAADITITAKFSNAITAMDFLQSNSVDLVFLDIQMPKVTGIEFAEKLSSKTLIIFTTAYSQYALKSYELDAIDYLLKPIDKNRLQRAIDKAIMYKLLSKDTVKNSIEASDKDFLFIKSDRRFYKIGVDDIRFIEGLKDYVVIYTQHQKLITAMNLKTIHQKIIASSFIRVSKSYIVNTNFIESFDSHTIFISEFEIPIGDVYKNDFFDQYSGGTLGFD